MNNQKSKFRRQILSPAEKLLKQKHDATKLLADQMAQKSPSQEELESRLAERRRLARLQLMQEYAPQKQQSSEAERQRSMINQSANSGGNIHNNINVAINYVVQEKSQKTEMAGRRKKGKKAGGKKRHSQDRMSEKDLMNSSLSKMLDQELLMGQASSSEQQPPASQQVRSTNEVTDSLTHDIFHGDKIYLKGGNMAFKPLGMETVLEANEDAHNTNSKGGWNKSMMGRHMHTTEQNIALQQQLDDATAQELVSFPRPRELGLKVNEDYRMADVSKTSGITQKSNLKTVRIKDKKGGLAPSRSATKDLSNSVKSNNQFSSKVPSESRISFKTLDNSTKNRLVEQDRQLHRGLQQMQKKLKKDRAAPLDAWSAEKSASRMKDSFEEEEGVVISINENSGLVRDSSGESIRASQISGSNSLEPTSHKIHKQSQIADIIGQKLHRQGTGHHKFVSRKLRDMKYDNENQEAMEEDVDQLKTQTVMQNEVPLPSRMRQNRTFQPSNKANIIDVSHEEDTSSVRVQEDNNLSRLAKDFKMHQENQVRIQNLMALISTTSKGEAAGNKIFQFDDKISESPASLSAINEYQSNQTLTKLPAIGNVKIGESQNGDSDLQAPSTEFATQGQPASSKNTVKLLQEAQGSAIGATSRGAVSSMLLRDTTQDQFEIKRNTDTMVSSSKSIMNMRAVKNSISFTGGQNQQRSDYNQLSPNYADPNYADRSNIQKKMLLHQQMNGGRDLFKTATQNGVPKGQHQAKHKIVRSSLFNNNPVLDNRRGMLMSENNDSEYSIGHKSLFTKHGGGNEFSIRAEEHAIMDGFKSPRTMYQMRSVSHRRLQPLASQSQIRNGEQSKDRKQHQSINFNKALSYVMVKGKFQPSEKYISKNMMPYTNTQFNSVMIKSTNQRQTLNIKPVSEHRQIPQTSSKMKSRKQKGAKVRRSDQVKAHALAQAYQTQQQLGRKKGIILEDAELESENEGPDDVSVARGDNMTWQDVMDENSQLKDQIMNQIAIFEQYLKVAVLQKKAQRREVEAWHREQGLKRNHSVDDEMFRGDRDFEIEEENEESNASKLQMSAQRKSSMKFKKPNATMMGKKTGPYSDIKIEEYTMESSQSSTKQKQKGFGRRKSSSKSGHSRRSRRSSCSPSPISKHVGSISQPFSLEHSKSKPKVITSGGQKTYVQMDRKLSSKQFENMLLLKGESRSAAMTHKTHKHWITKIEKVWQKLNENRNSDVVKIQDEVKTNKQRIGQLTRDNLFELDVNFNDQKLFLKASLRTKRVKKAAKKSIEVRRVQALEKRYRNELDRKIDFDTWGFHNHIIEYRLKVRMTEDVIDCAQRVSIKSDIKTQRELTLLKYMRDRLYTDLRYFIAKRETKPWRNWDRSGFYYKPSLENRDLDLQQVTERIDANLMMIAYIEPLHTQLIKDIPPYNVINSEMIQFCTENFGNEGWLQLFQLKMLRKQQEDEQHKKQYMPPVDHIKKMEVDPYTLQIEEPVVVGDQKDNQVSKEEEPKQEEKKMIPSAWHIRKPEKANQAKLLTGYEKMMGSQDNLRLDKMSGEGGVLETEQGTASPDMTQSSAAKQQYYSMPTNVQDAADYSEGSSAKAAQNYDVILNSEDRASSFARLTEGQTSSKDVTKFEGEDVVQHLKDMASLGQKQEMQEREADQIARSNWLQVLEREKKEKAEREAAERKARAARLAILFEDEDLLSQDDEDMLDAGAAKQHVSSYIDKIDTHLKVERRLLEAWQENDGVVAEGAGEDPITTANVKK